MKKFFSFLFVALFATAVSAQVLETSVNYSMLDQSYEAISLQAEIDQQTNLEKFGKYVYQPPTQFLGGFYTIDELAYPDGTFGYRLNYFDTSGKYVGMGGKGQDIVGKEFLMDSVTYEALYVSTTLETI